MLLFGLKLGYNITMSNLSETFKMILLMISLTILALLGFLVILNGFAGAYTLEGFLFLSVFPITLVLLFIYLKTRKILFFWLTVLLPFLAFLIPISSGF